MSDPCEENSLSSDEDEQLNLPSDALAALQSVLGSDVANLSDLLRSRRLMTDDSSSEEDDAENHGIVEDDDTLRVGESHGDYYRRMYPERYVNDKIANELGNSDTYSIKHPRALVTMEDPYVRNLILTSFANRYPHWEVQTELPAKSNEVGTEKHISDESTQDNYHLHWGEYEHIDWFSTQFTTEEILVSSYYNRKGLIRKGHLAQILENWHAKYKDKRPPISPKSYLFRLPTSMVNETMVLTDNLKTPPATQEITDQAFLCAFKEALLHSGFPGFSLSNIINESDKGTYKSENNVKAIEPEGETWILKPSVTNQAVGISLVQSEDQLCRAIYEADAVEKAGDFVLQQYISPLLLDKRKFHLRVFLLLHGNLSAYVSSDFLAIFSLEPYDHSDIQNTKAHFTNISHQEVLSIENQHRCMRSFDETKQDMVDSGLVKDIEEAENRIEQVRQKVYGIIAQTVEAVSSELTFTSKQNCFELFGLDLMVDPEWNVWLLEANAEPDLSKAGERLQLIIDKMLVDTLEIIVKQDSRFYEQNDWENTTSFVKVFERKGRSY